MPTNVVRTAAQERMWKKAKQRAAAQGHALDYAYVMGIYQRMLGEDASKSLGLTSPPQMAGMRIHGQLPRGVRSQAQQDVREAERLLAAPTRGWSIDRATDRPVLTPRQVVADLGLSLARENTLALEVDQLTSMGDELTFRQSWAGVVGGEAEPVVRAELARRGLALWRSRVKERTIVRNQQPRLTVPADRLEKAVMYIGPRGGRWADPQHKIPWDDKVHGRAKIVLTDKTAEGEPEVAPAAPPAAPTLLPEELEALQQVAGTPGGVLFSERYQAGERGRKITVKVTTGVPQASLGKLFTRGLLELRGTPEGSGYTLTETGAGLAAQLGLAGPPAREAPALVLPVEKPRLSRAEVDALPVGSKIVTPNGKFHAERISADKWQTTNDDATPGSFVHTTTAHHSRILPTEDASGKQDHVGWRLEAPAPVAGVPLPAGTRTEMGALGKIANQEVTHVVATPPGIKRQGFFLVGRYPAELGYERDDGQPLTEAEAARISQVGPGPHHRARIWPTAEAAKAAVEAAGGRVASMPEVSKPAKESEPGWERMPEDEDVAPVAPLPTPQPRLVLTEPARGKQAQLGLFGGATTAKVPRPTPTPAPTPVLESAPILEPESAVPPAQQPVLTVPVGPSRAGGGKGSRKDLAVEQGEHVWGSRADLAGIRPTVADLRSMNPAQQAKLVTKANLLPESDPEAMLAAGASPGAIILRKTIEGLVSSKAADTQESREAYMEGVDFLARSLDGCKTASDVREFVQDWMHLSAGQVQGKTYTQDELAAAKQEYLTAHGLEVTLTQGQINVVRREAEALWEQARAIEGAHWQQTKDARRHRQPEPPPYTEDPKWQELRLKAQLMGKMIEKAQEAMPNDRDVLTWKEHAVKYDIGLVRRADGSVATFTTPPGKSDAPSKYRAMARALGDRIDRLVLVGGGRLYSSRDVLESPKLWRDASGVVHAMAKEAPEAQVQKMREMVGDKSRKTPEIGRGERFKWEREVPGEIDRKGGKPVVLADPAKFCADFGFKNVQFGNWVSDDDANTHLKGAHGALFDLADLLGAEPLQVSFNGRLSMGFGARGHGKASAHYEPSQQIINLTKMAGGGSLAHEWGHALDHLVSMAAHNAGSAGQMLSAGFTEGVDPKVAQAFDKVMTVMRWGASGATRWEQEKELAQLNREAKTRDLGYGEKRVQNQLKRSLANARPSNYLEQAGVQGSYWTSSPEMFARAFEAWVEDSLVEQGRKSSYLVAGTRVVYSTGKYTRDQVEAQPYPQGDERKAINAAMSELVTAIRETGALKKALEALDARQGEPRLVVLEKAGGLGEAGSPGYRERIVRFYLQRAGYSGERLEQAVARVAGLLVLEKAGPYVGPRGGLWADPKHTIHWDPKVHGAGGQADLFAEKPKAEPKLEVAAEPGGDFKGKTWDAHEAARGLPRWEFIARMAFRTLRRDGKKLGIDYKLTHSKKGWTVTGRTTGAVVIQDESAERLVELATHALRLHGVSGELERADQWRAEALTLDAAKPAAPALTVPAGPSLPARTLDTMSDAIALGSPSGKQSKASQQAAQARLGEALFGEGGLKAPQQAQPSKAEALRRQAADLRKLAANGVQPKKHLRVAAELEWEASQLAETRPAPPPGVPTPPEEVAAAQREAAEMDAVAYRREQAERDQEANRESVDEDKARWAREEQEGEARRKSQTFRSEAANGFHTLVVPKLNELLGARGLPPVSDEYLDGAGIIQATSQLWHGIQDTRPGADEERTLRANLHKLLEGIPHIYAQGDPDRDDSVMAGKPAYSVKAWSELSRDQLRALDRLLALERGAKKSLRLVVPVGTSRLQKSAGDDGFCKAGVPRGGQYTKRTPRPGGGYRYYYSEKGYERATGHVDGARATEQHLQGRVRGLLERAGAQGVHPSRLGELVRRHGRQQVAAVLKGMGCRMVKGRLCARR